jgi:plasmid maintenance system antidote protein VapI
MTTFAELVERAERHDEFWEEDIAGDFTEELVRWMEDREMSKSQLAAKIGHRPSYITKVLRGTANLTAASMAKLARAVGARVRIHLAHPQSRTVWHDVYDFHTAETRLELNPSAVPFEQQRVLRSRPSPPTSEMRPIPSPLPRRDYQRERMSGVTR